jgi:hypothetical protein
MLRSAISPPVGYTELIRGYFVDAAQAPEYVVDALAELVILTKIITLRLWRQQFKCSYLVP